MPEFKPKNRGFNPIKEKQMQSISPIQNAGNISRPPKKRPNKSLFQKIKEKLCQMFGAITKLFKN